MAIKGQSFLKAALLIAASAGLSGCVYDVGLGFASDGYHDGAYGCDPYGGYDAYYNCDYGQAFSNIGFGGGWYDNYYYPGHGIFLFDTFGRRYPMREQYRRYWGERRHNWYREHRRRDLDRNRYEGRERYYKGNPRYERLGSPDRREDRMQDGHDRHGRRPDGRRNGNDQWLRVDGRGAGAAPLPNTGASQGQGRGQDYRDDYRQPDRRGSAAPDRNTAPAAPLDVSRRQQNVTSAEQPPEPRPEQQTPRQRMPEGGVERPD
ncbi:MAG: hypothetical protein CFE36_09835 [Sphingomonadaceae bacterium PASS1]|nr:MAG: hypothetical protein CFE36_09835 [Sphingomonadaceae bacterium PASS1]